MLIIASTHKRVRWNPLKDIINSFITIEIHGWLGKVKILKSTLKF